MPMQSLARETFERQFDAPPTHIVRSPGRVNLIGEHTDYSDGFVLPMAIPMAVWIALSPDESREVRLYSRKFDESMSFSLDDLQPEDAGWVEYIKGTAALVQAEGAALRGWKGVIVSSLPLGAGLSSSAALELAAGRAFAATAGNEWLPKAAARLAHRVENEWIGVRSGVMDQLISALGCKGHALLIDCRSLETTAFPLPAGTSVVVMDTATRRELLDSGYNERREQTEAAARALDVGILRDASEKTLRERQPSMDPILARRARHVLSENARTLAAAEALQGGDAVEMGRLMNASHVSLREDFEVSSRALNKIVACALDQASCFGARMTGGGFGGAAVALVRSEAVEEFCEHVEECYSQRTSHQARFYVCEAAEGTQLIEVEA